MGRCSRLCYAALQLLGHTRQAIHSLPCHSDWPYYLNCGPFPPSNPLPSGLLSSLQLRGVAVPLVDAFGIPDHVLRAPIGLASGAADPYGDYLHAVGFSD